MAQFPEPDFEAACAAATTPEQAAVAVAGVEIQTQVAGVAAGSEVDGGPAQTEARNS